MLSCGIDMGTSTLKLVLMQGQKLESCHILPHHGRLLKTLEELLKECNVREQEPLLLAVTGANARALTDRCPKAEVLGEIPAIAEGVKSTLPQAGSIIDLGGQGSRFITGLKEAVPRFHSNEHCAGGTGSFFEDQMSRLGLPMESYSEIVKKAKSVPRLSGRCAVFAKTDIIHRQQEGAGVEDILLGLCYAMIRNFKATIVGNLPVEKPVAFIGGVTQNEGVKRALYEVFHLREEDLLIPPHPLFQAALGAAQKARAPILFHELMDSLQGESSQEGLPVCPPLRLREGTCLTDPKATGVIPPQGCALGIDIGSTSTDLVLISPEGSLIDLQYLPTAGNPERAVSQGLKSLKNRYGSIPFLCVGVTGSGRERIGRLLGADTVKDEITAQARAASYYDPQADTVFEIGGQDSKYISLSQGEVVDFQMNKICAAGTGSFVEEQAARMDIPLSDFGPLSLTASSPIELGERCTVFMETAIDSALAQGATQAEIAAGLCHSIVKNYLHKVVGGKPVGEHLLLQGGVAYNPGIVAAFQGVYGDRLKVSPCFSISGAFGAALLALEENKGKASRFRGFDASPNQVPLREVPLRDVPLRDVPLKEISKEAEKNLAFYSQVREAFYKGYDGSIDPHKQTVGIPYALMMHKFFPMAHMFFKTLSYNVLLSDPSNEETIRLSQQLAQGETCYPVKLIYGHMQQLIDRGVDYIFMPQIHTLRHEHSHVKANYGCVYMQSAPSSIGRLLHLEEKKIPLLAPVFDLDMGKEAMASAMLSVGQMLGKPKPLCLPALMAGARAVRQVDIAAEAMGKALLSNLGPEEKVLVLITRNYGLSDPVLNMGIPQLLIERGHKVLQLSHLPGHDIDLEADHPNLYWPFGQHILSGAKMVAHHPNLYAVYLTNHGCGPDTMLSHLFREEMGEKPYLQIEVDEHFSPVGIITRIEAFLHSLSHREAKPLPPGFQLTQVGFFKERFSLKLPEAEGQTLFFPDLGLYTPYLCQYLQRTYGLRTLPMPQICREVLLYGRAENSAKEYLPFTALLGSALSLLEGEKAGESYPDEENLWLLFPSTQGAEADGQYAKAIRAILNRRGHEKAGICAPLLETIPARAKDPHLLLRALLTADLLCLLPPQKRRDLTPKGILSPTELFALAREAANTPWPGRRLGVVGTPLCQTSLDEGLLEQLEKEGEHLLRSPLSEYLLFLWTEEDQVQRQCQGFLKEASSLLEKLSLAAGQASSFSESQMALHEMARPLTGVNGGNVRYRYAKAEDLGQRCRAVLSLSPRYENASMVMEIRGLSQEKTPITQVYLDGDWDEAAWTRLRSFLYYV